MAVIDLSADKYKRNNVVVKCGDREFVATPDDATLDKIMSVGKKQMADGVKATKRLSKIDFDDLKDDDIDEVVNETVGTVSTAKTDYVKLADSIFGKGAGDAIYKYLGSSTLVMQDVMEDVVNELYAKRKEQKKKAKKKYSNKAKKMK